MAISQKTAKDLDTAVAIGAGAVALSAAAYLLFGPRGQHNRKALRGWALRMKGEILERLEGVEEITEPVFRSIVADVAAKYARSGKIKPEDLRRVVSEMEGRWQGIAKSKARKGRKPRTRIVGATVKRSNKKRATSS